MVPITFLLADAWTSTRCRSLVIDIVACFGGNATLVAAAPNVAAVGMAARAGRPIGFVYFLRIGVPVTFVLMIMATAYIAVRYL